MKTLLIVVAAPSKNVTLLKQAIIDGAHQAEANIVINAIAPLDVKSDDVLSADAIILGTTENFGYMSGELKTFFDRIYYPCLEVKQGLPYALMVKAGNDGSGAIKSISPMTTGLRWKEVQPATLFVGKFQDDWLATCHELGLMMALSLEQGII